MKTFRTWMRPLVLLLGMLPLVAQAAPDDKAETKLVEKYKLKRLSGTSVWVVREEIQLREQWDELPGHRDAIHRLEQALSQQIERGQRQWQAMEALQKTLRATRDALPANDPQRGNIEQQLKSLEGSVVQPERLGNVPAVREQIVELVDHRQRLWLTTQAIRRRTPALDEQYKKLQAEAEISPLLTAAGANQRLGPARPYAAELKKLEEYEQLLLTDWTPLWQVGKRQRVSLIANESSAITVTWHTSPEPSFITASMADTCGVKVDNNAPRQMISSEKRSYQAKKAKLESLRLGKYLIRDVEVWVLPAEAESLGARLSAVSLKGHQFTTDASRLRLVVKANVGSQQK